MQHNLPFTAINTERQEVGIVLFLIKQFEDIFVSVLVIYWLTFKIVHFNRNWQDGQLSRAVCPVLSLQNYLFLLKGYVQVAYQEKAVNKFSANL